jgi:hypothetical protein
LVLKKLDPIKILEIGKRVKVVQRATNRHRVFGRTEIKI